MTDAELIARLGSVPLFADLDERERSDIAIGVRLLCFAPGEALMRQGEKSDGIYFILSGQVQVTTRLPGGGETLITELGPGSTLGELALIRSTPRTATVTASEPVEAVYADWRFLRAALGQLRPGAFKVFRSLAIMLAGRLRVLHDRIRESAICSDCPYEMLRLPPPPNEPPAGAPNGIDVAAFLPVLPCFRDFDRESLQAVQAQAAIVAVRRGYHLLALDRAPREMWIVVRGAVASGFVDSGSIHLVNVRGPGSFCAVDPLIEDRPANADYIVCANAVLLAIPREGFRELFLGVDQPALQFLTAVTDHQAAMIARATNHLKRLVGLSRLLHQLRAAPRAAVSPEVT